MKLAIVKFCAEECKRQNSGELSVYHMCSAYEFVQRHIKKFNAGTIAVINGMVEPATNPTGTFRTVPVHFANGSFAIPADQVESAVNSLMRFGGDLMPEEFIKEFLDIHPFVDGNGRTAAILYNWYNGTMDDPKTMPDFYGKK